MILVEYEAEAQFQIGGLTSSLIVERGHDSTNTFSLSWTSSNRVLCAPPSVCHWSWGESKRFSASSSSKCTEVPELWRANVERTSQEASVENSRRSAILQDFKFTISFHDNVANKFFWVAFDVLYDLTYVVAKRKLADTSFPKSSFQKLLFFLHFPFGQNLAETCREFVCCSSSSFHCKMTFKFECVFLLKSTKILFCQVWDTTHVSRVTVKNQSKNLLFTKMGKVG